jgi:hypothetical protein
VTTGAIVWGRNYVVRGADVVYSGDTYSEGETFTGEQAVTEFAGVGESEPGEVYEYDGIYHDAPPQGLSNEWLLNVNLRVYHTSESSLWKPSAYSDQFWYSNRCHFYSSTIDDTDELRWHYNYGTTLSLKPESPDGWNFAKGVNTEPYIDPDTKIPFFKSCQIYRPPAEIDSATVSIESGIEVVCLTLTGRLQNTYGETGGAPASIARDRTGWDAATIHTEATSLYRTDENGLREYLMLQDTGSNCARAVIGDAAQFTDVWSLPDDPFGACFPFFHLTKLMAKPYADANDDQDICDTPLWYDQMAYLEVWLKACCGGFVDGLTTSNYGCKRTETNRCSVTAWGLFDYTFENLCYDAFGGRWLPLINTTLRAEKPQGYGPSPNVRAFAEVYNSFAKMLNKLDKCRVPLPLKFEESTTTYQTVNEVEISDSGGGTATCTNSTVHGYWEGSCPVASTYLDSYGYTEVESVKARQSATFDMDNCGTSDEDKWRMILLKEVTLYRVSPVDPDSLYAIPESWRDMVPTSTGCLACVTVQLTTDTKAAVNDGSQSACNEQTNFWPTGSGTYLRFDNGGSVTSYCTVITAGTLVASPLGVQTIPVGRDSTGSPCVGAPENSIQVTPWLDETTFVQIPLA